MSSESAAVSQHDERVEHLEEKIEVLQGGLDRAWETIDELQEENDALWDVVEELRDADDEFRDEFDRLDARTDLLRLVESSDDMSARQRSIALLQNLRQEAEQQRQRGHDAHASVNREEAERALQYPDVDRTAIYEDMKRAERLVGNQDVVWYSSRSGGESRLKLSLEAGSLPSSIRGEATDNGGEDL